MSAREELAELLQDNITDALPIHPWRGEIREQVELAVQHVLAAGYTKQRTVTTVEELDALGFEAVVLDPCGTPAICQRSTQARNEWSFGGTSHLIDSRTLLLSGSECTVLHEGDVSHRAAAPEPQS